MGCVPIAIAWLWALAGYSQSSVTPGGRADRISFEHYGQEKGLSQGTGYDIIQFDGFMWFATQDGLNRFDGYEFRVFRPGGQSGLASSVVQTLLVDKRGQFWVGTGGGLNRYDKATERFTPFGATVGGRHRLDSVSIERLLEDKAGNLWVMTDEKGLYCFDTRTHKTSPFFKDDHSLYGLCLDAGGNLFS